ncbi:unnamed protein product [Closterium sp. NIES-64]|nr:unnamed protein product [Closterium sp. NIES-64]
MSAAATYETPFDESTGSGNSSGCVYLASCSNPSRNNEDVDPEAPASCRTVSFDVSQETHYVIVVHGTFAPPANGPRTPWYQPAARGDSNFCNKLGALLAEGPLGDGCLWRELPAEPPPRLRIPYPFHWDGTNRHEGRIDAAHQSAQSPPLLAFSSVPFFRFPPIRLFSTPPHPPTHCPTLPPSSPTHPFSSFFLFSPLIYLFSLLSASLPWCLPCLAPYSAAICLAVYILPACTPAAVVPAGCDKARRPLSAHPRHRPLPRGQRAAQSH